MTANRNDPIVLRPAGGLPRTGADTPRLLLLHGMAGNSGLWDAFLAAATTRAALGSAEIWLAELPWRGGARPEWMHRDTAADWLERTLALATATAGRFDVVVAHSFAATALLTVLCREDQLGSEDRPWPGLSGVVFVAPFYRAHPADFCWDTIAGLPERFVDTMQEGIRVVAGGRGNPDLHRAMAQRVCEEIGPYGWARFIEQYLNTPWLRAGLLGSRALVVCGEDDTIAVPAEGRALADALPAASHHAIAGCGHFPMVERAEPFTALIDQFCSTLSVLEHER